MDLNAIHGSIIENLSNLDMFIDDKSLIKSNNKFEPDSNSQIYSLFCKKCLKPPQIKLTGLTTLNSECECFHIINISPQYFLNNYLLKIAKNSDSKNKEENYFKCQNHSMKYVSFCDDCFLDMCEKCLADKCHLTHTLFRFPDIYEKCKNILLNFISLENEKLGNESKGKSQLIKLMKGIIFSYKNYPCYNNYKNLNNLFNFIRQIKENNNDKNIYQKENIKMELFLKIKKVRELKDLINNFPEKINLIESIKIQAQNFYNLNLLKINAATISYNNLIELDLKKNNISDITPLISINFPELKYLDLSMNRLSDQNLDDIHRLFKCCNKLQSIDLSNNAFTDYKLFEFSKDFKYLKKLNLGNNLFNFNNKNINDEKNKFDFSNIEELELSYGVFSKQSIELMKNFKINNLKILNLCTNNLNSLSFTEKMVCDKLEELWLSNNHLKEFGKLKKFKKLKLLDLQGNKISDINKLNEFLCELPDIEKLNLFENKIDLSLIQNYEIIKKAKKQRNSKNDKIKLII